MKSIKHLLIVAVASTVFGFANSAQAQGFDRAEMMKRMADRLREQLDVKNDDEWAIISERIKAVAEARTGGFTGGRGGPPGGFSGRSRGGQGDADRSREGGDRGGDRGSDRGGDRGGDRGRGPGSFGGDPDSARGKLSAAIQANASGEEIKKLLDAYRADRDANEKKLKDAQAALREVITQRQEAVLVLFRMLD